MAMAKVAGILSNDQQVNKNNVSDTGILSKKNPTNSLYYEYEGSHENDIDRLYNSFINAETGHLREENAGKFIRTQASKTPGGSSAYGPAQMTGTLVRDMLERKIVPDHLKAYANRFLEQSEKFLKYGNKKGLEGYDPKYDYGGEGHLTSKQDQEDYKELAKSILAHHWKNAQAQQRGPLNDPINTIIHAWRFGPSSEKGEADDQNYWDRFKKRFYPAYPTK